MQLMRTLLDGLLHLVLPPACWCCDASLPPEREHFCATCEVAILGDMAPLCLRCGATRGPNLGPARDCSLCRGQRFAFTDVCRLGPYTGELRRLVLELKRVTGEQLAELLGRYLAARVQAAWPEEPFVAIVPVPLHWWRYLQRGYNQSRVIAEGLASILKIPCRPRWVRRTRATPPQTQLSPTARKLNVRDAFTAAPGLAIAGKPVLVVDDILTTGSTVDAVARELIRVGASDVRVAVLSRAE